MKVLILAGGYGTRLSEYTHEVPKPMVPIGKIPILVHIMNLYSKYNFNDFIIATGYKSEIINNYFLNESSSVMMEENDYLKVKFHFVSNNSSVCATIAQTEANNNSI